MDNNLRDTKPQNGPQANSSSDPFAQLPTETEIYILPGGEIIVADLPAELAARLEHVRTTSAPAPNDEAL